MTKIVFMGTPDFSVPILRTLVENGYDVVAVVTQPDRPVGRKKVLTPPPVKVEALAHRIPVFQPEKIRRPEELAPILELKPDLVVTAAFGQILPNELLEAPKYGCINVHASLLPELRGGAPIHYAILQGKKTTGITIMYMAEQLDAGAILTQREIEITEEDNVGTLFEKLSKVGCELLIETLPKLLANELTAIPQAEEKATFAPNIKREQEKIDWTKSGEEIYNQVRGLNPWPVAFTVWNELPLKVWKAAKVPATKQAAPGTVLELQKDGIVIATGNETAIKMIEIQPSGKKKMPAAQFLQGKVSMSIGEKIGD